MLKGIATAVLVSAAMLSLGCTETTNTKSPEIERATQVSIKPTPGLSARQRLRRSLELLEEGDERRARVELVEYVSNAPRSRTGKSLLRQIDTAPEDYYPAEYREVILETGQSLSTIAKNYLGSAVQFHALAKYNAIARPRRVVPGQIVRVPLTPVSLEVFAGLDANPASENDGNRLPGGASAEVVAADVETGLSADSAASIDDSSVAGGASQAASAESPTDRVSTLPAEIPAAITDDASSVAMPGLDANSTSLATDAENALIELEREVPDDVPPPLDVDTLHRRAITAYRSQDLDTAISLWDEILAADPGYESARLYRSQALQLKKRLKSLN